MEESLAQRLFESFSKHPYIPIPQKERFIPDLRKVDVEQPEAVFTICADEESLKETGQLAEEDERYHYLSLRRVIVIQKFHHENLQLPGLSAVFFKKFVYSSNMLLEDLVLNADLKKIVRSSDMPYAVLGKLKTYDYGNEKKVMFHIARPILVIPGQERNENVLAWEESKTLYQREFGLLGVIPTSRRYYEEVSCGPAWEEAD